MSIAKYSNYIKNRFLFLNKSGFTLIEMTVVMILFAIISGLALTTQDFFNGILVKSEMQKLHMACLYMQQVALTSATPERMIFNTQKGSYSFDAKEVLLSKWVQFGVIPGTKGPPAQAHTYITNPITFINNCITFYTHGIIQAGTIYCVDRCNKYMYAISSGIAHTSHIRLYGYNTMWQLLG